MERLLFCVHKSNGKKYFLSNADYLWNMKYGILKMFHTIYGGIGHEKSDSRIDRNSGFNYRYGNGSGGERQPFERENTA